MILEILHVNGDVEDIQGRYHNGTLYQQFVVELRDKVRRASKVGANIIYRPNLKDIASDESEVYFTTKEDSIKRHVDLKRKFPFLEGLERVTFTLLPDGLYAPTYVEQIDQMIENDQSKIVIIGGKYTKACVATVARNTQARNPAAKVFIGDDVSFEGGFPPEEFYKSIHHTTLERYLK